MPRNLESAVESTEKPKMTPLARISALPLNNFVRAAIVSIGLLTSAGIASAKPQQDTKNEQVDYSNLSEKEIIYQLAQILGETTVRNVLYPERRDSWEYRRGRVLEYEHEREDHLTDKDLDDVSPAEKLASLQKARAAKSTLANKLRPLLEQAVNKQFSWAHSFDEYLEVPDEPRVAFADGKFKTFSNAKLLGEMRTILGPNTVERTLNPRSAGYGRYGTLIESNYYAEGELREKDLDSVSPVQKLATLRTDRAQKQALADRLGPPLEEAERRGLSWPHLFKKYLEVPDEPRVDFADGKFGTHSNVALFKEVKSILGEDLVTETLRYPSGKSRGYSYSEVLSARSIDYDYSAKDLIKVSPASKLAELQKIRAQRKALADQLGPFLEESTKRGLSWPHLFKKYLEVPDEPQVDFADGRLRNFSNFALLGEVKNILGTNYVETTIRNRFEGTRGYRGVYAYGRTNQIFSDNDLDEVSPAEKLAELQKVRAQKKSIADKLGPFLAEAIQRGLSWPSLFEKHLEVPAEPKVDFADGNLRTISNKGLLDKITDIVGSEKFARILSFNSYNGYGVESRPELMITKEEATRLAPLLLEANRRKLTWPSKVERFFQKNEVTPPPRKEVQKQDPKNTDRINGLVKQIKDAYGIKIAYGVPSNTSDHTGSAPTNQKLIESELSKLINILSDYPKHLFKSSQNKTVYFCVDLKKGKEGTGGYQLGSTIVINLQDGVDWAFDHELFHFFDEIDGLETDDKTWARVNPSGMKDYVYKNSAEAIRAGQGFDDPIPPTGFARTYGKKAGPNEDQATIAENLRNSITSGALMKRAKKDEVLRAKMEMITGCHFDPNTGLFSNAMTLREYQQKFGFTSFQYYAKWSRTKNGNLSMNATFWNRIAKGKRQKFN
jgi:hypothetical protein